MATKQPTNADLLKELKAMQAVQVKHSQDITDLMMWRKIDEASKKAAKEAVDEYKRTEPTSPKESTMNRDLIKYLGYALAIIATLIGASGIKP